MSKFKVGDCIKDKYNKGIIEEIYKNGYLVGYHNGMKMSTKIIPFEKAILITKQELIKYCKKRGDTSFLDIL